MPDRIFTPGPISKGTGDLVSALLSGPAIREKARKAAVGDADAEFRARLRGTELRSKEGLGAALAGLGAPAELATVLNAGAGNFQQGTAGLQNLRDIALQNQAVEMAGAENPDVAAFNRLIAARAGRPLTPSQASVVPLGSAMVGTENARREAQLGNALVDQARASLLGRTDPNIRVSKGKVVSQSTPLGEALSGPSLESQLRSEGVPPELIAQIVQAEKTGGNVDVPVLGPGGVPVTAAPKLAEADVLQAIQDARAAIATGKITKQAAQARLRKAGMPRAAERL